MICGWHYMHLEERYRCIPTILKCLTQLIPSVKLTVEWETMDHDTGIATLPFLDVLIHRSPQGVTFSIYRKPTHCHSCIHYFSNHALHVKRGVLSSLFLRALRVCSPVHLQSELDTLTSAFSRLGYPQFFIKRALSYAKTKFHAPPSPTPSAPLTIWTRYPYLSI